MSVLDRLRLRWRLSIIPAHRRCTAVPDCRRERVAQIGDTNHCVAHPPANLAASVAADERCPACGHGYWPDLMHFDCDPKEAGAEP